MVLSEELNTLSTFHRNKSKFLDNPRKAWHLQCDPIWLTMVIAETLFSSLNAGEAPSPGQPIAGINAHLFDSTFHCLAAQDAPQNCLRCYLQMAMAA